MATTTMLLMAGAALFPEELEQHLPSVPPSFMPEQREWMALLMGEGASLHQFYTGRISTDANENLHSQLRADNVMHPNARTCRARLKAIALTQYEGSGPATSSTMIDYIGTLAKTEQPDEPVIIPDLPTQADEQQPLPLIQGQVLYYLSGWAVFTELKKSACEDCGEYCLSNSALEEHGYHSLHPVESEAVLTTLKSKGKLVHPSRQLHGLHMRLHQLMDQKLPAILSGEDDPLGVIMRGMDSTTTWLPPCHRITRKMIKRLATLKIHMLLKQKNSQTGEIRQFDSKSALRATSVK